MPEKSVANSLDQLPEVFVSDQSVTKEVSRAVKAGKLRKLASRLYTHNLTDPVETLISRNLWQIVAGYFPGALIADRTALENAPASDGSICLVTGKGKDIKLPKYTLRSRRGLGPIASDPPFVAGLFISSTARAYLENLRPSRARGSQVSRTLGQRGLEEWLDILVRRSGLTEINSLRDEILAVASRLDLKAEAATLHKIMGALLGTRKSELLSPVAIARGLGRPFDPARLALFQSLHVALRNYPPFPRFEPERTSEATATLAFFEAFFSNFIEGTEFTVNEASKIVFDNFIPKERPEDAHDVLGTWQIVSDLRQLSRNPTNHDTFVELLTTRHRTIMQSRPEKRPGRFKQASNFAGNTEFVEPELVVGTLEQGFNLYRSLENNFQRAVFMMFLVAEVHPFADGNGRTARIMMNAELVSSGEERIVIPTGYRTHYLSALRRLSQNGNPEPLIQMLDFAQKWTAAINWRSVGKTRRELEDCNAFLDSAIAEEEGKRFRMPWIGDG